MNQWLSAYRKMQNYHTVFKNGLALCSHTLPTIYTDGRFQLCCLNRTLHYNSQLQFAIQYKSNLQEYQILVNQRLLYSLTYGSFSTAKQFYDYLSAIRSSEDCFYCQKQGLVKIKMPKLQKWVVLQANHAKLHQSEHQNNYETYMEEQPQSLPESIKPRVCFQDCDYITGDEQQDQINKRERQSVVCYRAIQMLRQGADDILISQQLNITRLAARKLTVQYFELGKIYLPRGPKPSAQQINRQHSQMQSKESYSHSLIQLNTPLQRPNELMSGVGFNTKLPNQTVERIKRILLSVIVEGRMQSYEEMQKYLQKLNIYRSLSSIYRHVNSLKISNPELQNRNFAMHKKDIFKLEGMQVPVPETQK